MTSRGHYFAWCYLEQWATEEVKKGGPAGLLARYDRPFKHVLPFCAPNIDEWDALNHPVPFVEADALYNVVGPDVYPELYAKIRPQTDKLLFVNEDTFNPDRTTGFEKHLKHMIAKARRRTAAASRATSATTPSRPSTRNGRFMSALASS